MEGQLLLPPRVRGLPELTDGGLRGSMVMFHSVTGLQAVLFRHTARVREAGQPRAAQCLDSARASGAEA